MPPQILLPARVYASHLYRQMSRYVDAPLRLRTGLNDRGQTTAEYGLVILAAGTLALAAILWARSSGSITSLFQTVVDQLTGDIG